MPVPDHASFIPGFVDSHSAPEGRIAVRCDVKGQWHMLSTREWTILQMALDHAPSAGIAERSTTALRAGLGLDERLRQADVLPPWLQRAALSVSPGLRRYRNLLEPVTDSEASAEISRFLESGLLVAPPPRRAPSPSPNGGELCVFTADRPAALRRLLSQLAAVHARSQTAPVIHVHDSSRGGAVQDVNLATCAQKAQRSVTIQYVDDATRAALARRIVQAGIDRELVEWAILDKSNPGAMRNAAVLGCLGRPVVFLEDEILPSVWVPWEMRTAVRLTGEEYPCAFSFTRTRTTLYRGMIRTSAPPGLPHWAILGRPLRTVLAEHAVEVGGAPPPSASWGRRVFDPGSRVRLSIHGVIGRQGSGWAQQLLARRHVSELDPLRDRAAYDSAVREAHMRTTTPSVQLSSRVSGPAVGFGLDLTEIVPPFVPTEDCRDLSIWDTLGVIDPRAIAAVLPHTLEHWPDDAATARSDTSEHTLLRLPALLRFIVSARCHQIVPKPPAAQLELVGRAFGEVGNASIKDVRDVVRSVWWDHAARWLGSIERELAAPQRSEWWLQACLRLRSEVLSECRGVAAGRVAVLVKGVPTDAEALRTVLCRLAALYQAWPRIVAVARGG